jgi:chloride channel protein, CIC family
MMPEDQDKGFIVALLQKIPENARPFIVTLLLSIAAALSAVLFMVVLKTIYTETYEAFAKESPLYFVTASFILITVTSLIVGFLLFVFSPEAAGSGIPQVKSSYWKEAGALNLKPVIVKFVAGIFSIGGGSSLGREGPSVFIGSGVASNLDKVLGGNPRNKRAASLIGASAGLAAAFNTPLAAISFVIEEVVGDLNNRYLGRVVLSSVIGAFVVYAILGRQPAFSLPSIDDITWFHYLAVPVVAFAASYIAVIFQKYTLFYRSSLKKQKKFPAWLMPLYGGLITWAVGVFVFLTTGKLGIFGLGYNDLSDAMSSMIDWRIAGVLVIGKVISTTSSYSFGGCGGIFAPSLFIGALSGFFFSGIAGIWLPLTPADHIVLAAVGMSAYLGALLHAPLTSMLIVFEMTHQFHLVPALMIGMIISQAVGRRYSSLNFYDAILVQDGHELHKIRPPVDIHSWQNLPISVIASPKIASLKDLSPGQMRNALEIYPYSAFPVISDGKLSGIVSREEMQNSLKTGVVLKAHESGTCFSDQTVKEVGNKFIEYDIHVLVVLDRESGAIKGIITLHDLIRAQSAVQS